MDVRRMYKGGVVAGLGFLIGLPAMGGAIIQHAEHYVLEARSKETWKVEDTQLDIRLAQLREKHRHPPNIIHFMWDDTAWGDVGIPEISKIQGFSTPNFRSKMQVCSPGK